MMIHDSYYFIEVKHGWLWLAFFIPFWLGCYAYAIRFMWHALAPVARTKFSFYITDIWVGTVCLLPTLALIAETLKIDFREKTSANVGLAILVASQVLGIILARIFSFPRSGETMPRRTDQALWVAAGAYFFGIMGLAAVVIAFVVLAIPIMITIEFPPIGLGGALFFYLLYRRWKKTTTK